ncbi:hypothetical protein PG997_001496 [Apiospora hydei]|uniref:F-box domain-containing protein n=1 Tax=Apiospora hydei TaxID=1337664 RepID=A0ABR1XDR0_9PEZI
MNFALLKVLSQARASETFATAELLENILVHLDPKTFLTSAQLVQRRWRQQIHNSTPLQQQLFLRSIPAQYSSPREVNPLLKEHFPIFFYERPAELDTVRPPRISPEDSDNDPEASHSWYNAMRRWRIMRTEAACSACAIFRNDVRDDFETRLPWAASGERRRSEAFMRPGASWRAMLVAQPPIRLVGFVQTISGRDDTGMPYRLGELDMMAARGGGGLRMGGLYDAVAGCLAVTVAQQPDRAAACSIVWAPSAAMPVTFVSFGIGLQSLGERADLILELLEPSSRGGGDVNDDGPHPWPRVARRSGAALRSLGPGLCILTPLASGRLRKRLFRWACWSIHWIKYIYDGD